VVYVDNKIRAGLFSEAHLKLLAAFASQAAVAVENARLYTLTDEALRGRVAELQTMQAIDRELNAHLNFERVMQITAERGVRGTGAAAGWIGLMDSEANVLRVIAGAGPADAARPETYPADAPLLGSVLAQRKPARLAATLGGTARLIVPVLREGRAIGLIEVERPKANFTEEAEAFLARLADHAAIAIENARLYEAVRQANDAKSQFVSVVSHELKLPMTSIKGYTDILRQGMAGPVNDQQRQMLNTIRSNVDRMAVLVSDLSDISRIETGRLKLEIGPVSIAQALEETLVGLRPSIEGKNQSLTIDVPPDLPSVRADRSRVMQILTNLINNANKYTPAGGRLAIGATRAGGFARVSIADSGIGISPEDQAKLFSQFFRSDDPAVRDQMGWGLGLSITQRLIEIQGGEISATSESGKGSTFSFTLPISG
ncbi:MAG: GAF domain-containing sensor histidine kinase, partial [Chloroflexi bacterium]|nr:GAF domain-containing sensor histidine kinase [Chloroflexota bacterium]